jgi:hypothetical protein
MKHLMFDHVSMLAESLLAGRTFIRLESCGKLNGQFKIKKHPNENHMFCKLTIVDQIMSLQIGQLSESLVANLAHKGALAVVGLLVLPH